MITLPDHDSPVLAAVDLADPINWAHPLAQGLEALWLGIPGLDGGNVWYDLANGRRATYVQVANNGWAPSTLPGHCNDIKSTNAVAYDIPDTTLTFPGDVTFAAWFNPTSVGAAMYLAVGRGPSVSEWAFDDNRCVWGGLAILTATSDPATNAWNFIANERYGSTGSWTAEIWKGSLTSPVAANGTTTTATNPSGSGTGFIYGCGSSLTWQGRVGMQAWYKRRVPQDQLEWLRQISLIGYPGLLNYYPDHVFRRVATGAYSLAAAVGSFSLSGQAAGLRATRTIAGAVGTFTQSGQAAGLRAARKITAAVGSFALSGQAAGLLATRTLTCSAGAFSLSGQAAGLRPTRLLSAAVGVFTLTGQSATLTKGTPGAYTLTASPGSFVLSGQAVGLRATRTLPAGVGTFTLTGNAASLRATRTLVASVGAFTLSGKAATLTYSGATVYSDAVFTFEQRFPVFMFDPRPTVFAMEDES